MSCECTICSLPFVLNPTADANEDVSATKCGHTFHFRCLQQWLAINMTCPTCRIPVKDKGVVKKLFFEAEMIPPERDPAVLTAELQLTKAKVTEKDAKIVELQKALNASRSEREMDRYLHQEAQDISESVRESMVMHMSEMQVEMDTVRLRLESSEEELISMGERHQAELDTKEALLQSMYKETADWKKLADAESKKVVALQQIDELERAAIEWAETRARLLPELAQPLNDDVEFVWDTRTLVATVKRLRAEVNQKEESRQALLEDLARCEATQRTTTERHLAEMEEAEQQRQASLREIEELKAERLWALEAVILPPEVGHLRAALQSEQEQRKARKAAENSNRAMKQRLTQLTTKLEAVTQSGQPREAGQGELEREAASWKTALDLEQTAHHVTRGMLANSLQEKANLLGKLQNAQECLATRIKKEWERQAPTARPGPAPAAAGASGVGSGPRAARQGMTTRSAASAQAQKQSGRTLGVAGMDLAVAGTSGSSGSYAWPTTSSAASASGNPFSYPPIDRSANEQRVRKQIIRKRPASSAAVTLSPVPKVNRQADVPYVQKKRTPTKKTSRA